MVQYNSKDMERFMVDFAPSVRILRSFRAEDTDDPASDPNNPNNPNPDDAPDPFANLDLDNLPDVARASITAARTHFATLQKEAAEAKSKAEKNEQVARELQSRNDRRKAALAHHNIPDPIEAGSTPRVNPEEQELNDLASEFQKEFDLTPEHAKQYAKMHVMALRRGEQNILKKVGGGLAPHLQTVNSLAVRSVLETATENPEYAEVLQIPEVYEEFSNRMQALVDQGGTLDDATVDLLFNNAYAMHMRKGSNPNPNPPPARNNFRGGFRGPVAGPSRHAPMSSPRNNNNGGAPIPANQETLNAVNNVIGRLRKPLDQNKSRR